MRTLIVSDIHLGSGMTRTDDLLDFLEAYPGDELIIAGDLFEKDGDLMPEDREVIAHLRNRPAVTYIAGNHDPIGSDFGRMIGVKAKKKHAWKGANGEEVCVIHGHQFDKWCFIFSERMVDRLFLCLIWLLKKIDIGGYKLANWFDDYHANFAERVRKRAAGYAFRHGFSTIIYAHTHRPEMAVVYHKGKAIYCYNVGDWIDHCSFISLEDYSPAALYCQRAA